MKHIQDYNSTNKQSKKVLRTLAMGQSDITRHESIIGTKPKKYYLTLKKVVESFNKYLKSVRDKNNEYVQEYKYTHNDEEVFDYNSMCEYNISVYHQAINRIYGIRLQDYILDTATNGSIYVYGKNGSIEYYPQLWLSGPSIKVEFGNDEYINFCMDLGGIIGTYNGNDIISIRNVDATGGDYSGEYDEDGMDITLNNIRSLVENNVVFICPSGTLENFVIGYRNENGEYTTEKPSNIEANISFINNQIVNVQENFLGFGINITGQGYLNDITNPMVTELVSGDNWKKFYYGTLDFSLLSAADNIKIEVSKDVYDIVKNPWSFIDEDAVFSGKKVCILAYSDDEKLLIDMSGNGTAQYPNISTYDCGLCDGKLINLVKGTDGIEVKQIFTQNDLHDGQYSKEINGTTYISDPIETPRDEYQDFDSFIASECEITIGYVPFTKTANSNTFTNNDIIVCWINLRDMLENMQTM